MGIKLRVKLCEAGAVAHLLSLASFYLRVHRYLKKKKKKRLVQFSRDWSPESPSPSPFRQGPHRMRSRNSMCPDPLG